MATLGEKIEPQTGLVVCLANDYRRFSEKTLVEFYQPIMGANAFALLFALRQSLQDRPTLSNRISHARLLDQLGIDIENLNDAKKRLEGLELIQTFETVDQIGQVIVYELQPTLTPVEFVKDDLLSVLLLETVGETKFDSLVDSATRYQLDTSRLTKTTKTFFETFHVDESRITDSPAVIQESRQKFIVSQRSNSPEPIMDQFDFMLLGQLLAKQPLSKDELQKHQHLIRTEHLMYGIDEPQMARLIMESIDVMTNKIDEQRLKKTVSANYQIQSATSNDRPEQATTVNEQQAEIATVKLTQNERQLIKACESYAPNEFLQVLIGKKGGFVPHSSEVALQNLINRQVLNNSVINMLIYYVIQERSNASLSQNFIDTVATGWLQAKVSTATQALTEIKNFANHTAMVSQGTAKTKQGRTGQPRVRKSRETLPDWAQEGYHHQTKKVSEDEVSQIKAQLAALKHQQEGEK